jgi:hypothetical protein
VAEQSSSTDKESAPDDDVPIDASEPADVERDGSVAPEPFDASLAGEESDAAATPVVLASESCTGNIPFTTQAFEVFEDAASFQEAYASATGDADPPPIEFDTHVVLAAFAGMQSTSGTRVRFAAITERRDAVEVTVELSRAGNCIVKQAISYPFALAVAERSSLPFVFEEGEITRVCAEK